MALQEKDFIEVEFTGKTLDNQVFDSNIKSELEKINSTVEAKPFVFALGEGMFLPGIDEFLIGKEIGEYEIKLPPEKAFGKRDSKQIQMVPTKFFKQSNIQPITGATLNFDGKIGKILSVSGGRVLVDFNNPLAGKDVIYNLNILRKVEDIHEKVKAFNDFIFRRDFKFEVKEDKIIYEVEKSVVKFIELFQDKFKELFGLGLEVKEVTEQAEKELITDAESLTGKIKEKVEDKVEDLTKTESSSQDS